ncbi:MAG: tetratricopeptide repeat protein [Solirubrobacteraceae bacterium]
MLWGTRPVFVSSTFNDFQAERDVLQQLVFPELAERLRARRQDLEPIDLRFGIETASAADEGHKMLLVLSVCLNEVLRSRPFIVALLGECYGWVPPVDRARRALEEAGLGFGPELEARSITDLELDVGVLGANGSEPLRAFAYFRELDLTQADDELRRRYRDADRSRVDGLKQRLRAYLGPERCRGYSARIDPHCGLVVGLERFRSLVVQDLWSELEQHIGVQETVSETSPQAAELVSLDAFVHRATRGFVGRERVLAELLSLSQSPAERVDQGRGPNSTAVRPLGAAERYGVCLTGASGAGKSSVAAALIRRLGEDSATLVLEHVAGISADSTRVDRMLERWCAQLAAAVFDAEPVHGDLSIDDLEGRFARLLTRAAEKQRVVVVVDALNEFERTTRGRYLTWMPRLWPANARFIATSILGSESESLERRVGFELLPLEALSGEEADLFVDAIYRRYRRTVSPDVKRAILGRLTYDGAPASGNPLWLELASEEMNLLDPTDLARAAHYEGAPDRQLVLMQLDLASELPESAQAMYGRMLRRGELVAQTILQEQAGGGVDDRGAREWVRCLSICVAISREGWRERDLQVVLAQLSDVHWRDLLFSSVRRAYRGHLIQKGSAGQWNFYHRELRQAVLDNYCPSPQELRGLHAALAAHLETLPEGDPLRRTERMHHLIGADDRREVARAYAHSPRGSDELRTQVESLADLFRRREDAAEWVGSLLSEPELTFPERILLAEKIVRDLSSTLANSGYVDERRRLLSKARDETARLAQDNQPGSQNLALRMHSVSLLQLADLALDVGDTTGARSLYEEHLRIAERLAEASPGPMSQQDLGVALERLGELARAEGDIDAARRFLGRQLDVTSGLVAANPGDGQSLAYMSSALEHLGLLEIDHGNIDEAERYLRGAANALDEAYPGSADEPSAERLQMLGRLAEAKDDTKEARRLFEAREQLLRRRAEAEPEAVTTQIAWATSLDQLGDVVLFRGDKEEAMLLYAQAAEIMARLATLLPEDVSIRSRHANAQLKAGDAYLAIDDWTQARPHFECALTIQEGLHRMQPADVDSYRLLGLACERLSMLEDAKVEVRLGYLERALAVYTELVERLPENEDASRTLAIGHFAMAKLLGQTADRSPEVIDHSHRAHALLSDLRAKGRQLAPEARRILAFLDTQAGGSGRWTHPIAEKDHEAYGELNLLGMLGDQALSAGDYRTAEQQLQRSLNLASQIGHPPSIVRACGTLGDLRARTGNTSEAFELYAEAIAVARDNGLANEEGQTLTRLADLQAELGDRNAALSTYRERVELARRNDDQRGLATGLANIGAMLSQTGRPGDAIAPLTEAIELFESYRMWRELPLAYFYLGSVYQALGDYEHGIEAYSKQIEVCRRFGDMSAAAGPMANLSGLLMAVGRREEAIAIGKEAYSLLATFGSPAASRLAADISLWERASGAEGAGSSPRRGRLASWLSRDRQR